MFSYCVSYAEARRHSAGVLTYGRPWENIPPPKVEYPPMACPRKGRLIMCNEFATTHPHLAAQHPSALETGVTRIKSKS